MINKIRTCIYCGRTSENVKFFVRKRIRKCGIFYQVQNTCVACHKDNMRHSTQRWNEKNKERRNAINKKWRDNNKEQVREIKRVGSIRKYNVEYQVRSVL